MKLIKQIAILAILISVTVYALVFFNKKLEFFCTNSQGSEYYQIYGIFGDYIGGVLGTLIGFITLILVYLTYTSQKTELKLQSELISQQQFESTFFNMLNVHRELKNDLSFNIKNTITKLENINTQDDFVKGVNVFKVISKDYKDFYKLFNSEGKIIRLNLLNSGKLHDKLIQNHIKTGDENTDSVIINIKHFEIDKLNKVKNIMDEDKWNEDLSALKFHKIKIDFTFKLLFENYQDILSHYCRNAYHILKFIRETEELENLKKKTKQNFKKYANIFQSQLNVNEQFILFYNFYYFNENNKDIMSTIKLIEHYQFLENLGLKNLILEKHKELYPNLDLK